MFTRPFLPFRVRPLNTEKPRAVAASPVDVLAAIDLLKPLSVKAQRKSVRAMPVAMGTRTRLPVRGSTRVT